MRRRTLLGATGVAVVGSLTGCTRAGTDDVATEVVEDSFDGSSVDTLTVDNQVGDVLVRTASVDGVTVRVLKRSTNGADGLQDLQTSATVSGGALAVETAVDDDARWFTRSAPSTDVTVTVPQGDSGPFVETVRARLGNVTLRGTRGDTDVTTELGDVTVRDARGYPSVRSDLGDVVVLETTGLRDVRTDLGEVLVQVRDTRSAVDVGTDVGDIAVEVAADLQVSLVVIGDGRLAEGLPIGEVRRRERRLTASLNGGGPELRVSSDVGSSVVRPIDEG